MLLVKTVKVKVFRPTNVKKQFLGLLEENARLLNHYVKVMEEHKTVSKTELHRLTYRELRASCKLPSAVIQTCRDKAVEAFKSFRRRKRAGKASLPRFNASVPVRLDARTFKVIETDNKLKFFAVVTVNGSRVFVPLLGQRYQYKYLAKLLAGSMHMGSVELVKRGNDFYFYISMKKDVAVKEPSALFTPIGVDLGLVNLSTSVILKEGKPVKVVFHSGGKAMAKRNYFAWFRKQLGQAKKLWRIKATREKEARFMRDLNHKVSSTVIQQALTVKNPVIVLEDLKYIRQRIRASRKLNKHLHAWSFRQLQDFIEYKANWQGIPVVYVSARFTSQRCSKCGHIEKANRNGRTFKCKNVVLS